MQKPNIRRKCFVQWSYADKQDCFELKGLILSKAKHEKYIFKSHMFQSSKIPYAKFDLMWPAIASKSFIRSNDLFRRIWIFRSFQRKFNQTVILNYLKCFLFQIILKTVPGWKRNFHFFKTWLTKIFGIGFSNEYLEPKFRIQNTKFLNFSHWSKMGRDWIRLVFLLELHVLPNPA